MSDIKESETTATLYDSISQNRSPALLINVRMDPLT